MSAFDYLSVLVSIILGLAVTQLLTSVARLVQRRGDVVPYWPSLVWTGMLLVADVQVWWALFETRSVSQWTFGGFFTVLLIPIVMCLLNALVLPQMEGTTGTVDLRENYQANARWFLGLFTLVVPFSFLRELALYGSVARSADSATKLFFMITTAVGVVVRNERYHKFLAIFSALGFIGYCALLFSKLR